MKVVKFTRQKTAGELHDEKVSAYWLLFLRAPSRKTGPGECVNLGEIGETRSDRGVERWCPYAPATGLK
jgi:hypothetical protein